MCDRVTSADALQGAFRTLRRWRREKNQYRTENACQACIRKMPSSYSHRSEGFNTLPGRRPHIPRAVTVQKSLPLFKTLKPHSRALRGEDSQDQSFQAQAVSWANFLPISFFASHDPLPAHNGGSPRGCDGVVPLIILISTSALPRCQQRLKEKP